MPSKDTVVVAARVPKWLEKHLDQWAGHRKLTRSQAVGRILKIYFGFK
jgi:hypothetical protein